MSLFMLDIETTGLDPDKEDVMQIAIVKMDRDGQFYKAGRSLSFLQRTSKQPKDDFARTYLTELYNDANSAPLLSAESIRVRLLDFMNEPYHMDRQICGWNAANFDLTFLANKDYLRRTDYNYRVYEMSGVVSFASDVIGLHREELVKRVDEVRVQVAGRPHDALYDCYKQIEQLNTLIKLAQEGQRHAQLL